MAARALRFYFDYLSPYAYLAWTQIHSLAARHDREVEPVPVLLAALLDAAGSKGPAEIPAKRVYILRDCVRTAHRLGVPFGLPPSHPFHPLLALRVSSLPMEPAQRRALVTALFDAVWKGGGSGVESKAEVASSANSVGLDGAALVEAAAGQEAKDRVRRATEEAIAEGVFGVPSIVAEGELFWGLDALPNLEQHLRGDAPDAREVVGRWRTLRATAARAPAGEKAGRPNG